MRIITGKYKGRTIKMPKGIRPTSNKVRKALFDILGDIKGLSFLELFAGSGAVGIEALSQGAKEAVFVEKNKICLNRIKENLSVMGLRPGRVMGLDVFKAIKQLHQEGKKFDIIFLDPPYFRGLAKKTLKSLILCDILEPSDLVIIQHYKKDILPDRTGKLALFKQSGYGDTLLSFYKIKG